MFAAMEDFSTATLIVPNKAEMASPLAPKLPITALKSLLVSLIAAFLIRRMLRGAGTKRR
jgi:hypothetical protein